jgi:hypothetical protein
VIVIDSRRQVHDLGPAHATSAGHGGALVTGRPVPAGLTGFDRERDRQRRARHVAKNKPTK